MPDWIIADYDAMKTQWTTILVLRLNAEFALTALVFCCMYSNLVSLFTVTARSCRTLGLTDKVQSVEPDAMSAVGFKNKFNTAMYPIF